MLQAVTLALAKDLRQHEYSIRPLPAPPPLPSPPPFPPTPSILQVSTTPS